MSEPTKLKSLGAWGDPPLASLGIPLIQSLKELMEMTWEEIDRQDAILGAWKRRQRRLRRQRRDTETL